MKFARASFLALISICFTNCSNSRTWNSFKNSSLLYPVRFLDQTGSAMLDWLGENELPTDGKPASMQERARQIESRGHYAGRAPAAVRAAGQGVAAR
ncbi:MAG: hypothetical protein J0L73_25285 [Verrucomicrobia bacterium]|nr:hypothetical protein [Verrucomicrobiota bacterium]